MIPELLQIYRANCTNPGQPECTFAETLLFNEGWLLRGVLKAWASWTGPARFSFLPFLEGSKLYSEAQLYTPFKARYQGDKQAEGHTHVDGIVGDFRIVSKSGVALVPNWRCFAIYEAKMFSPLSSAVKYAPGYDQVSRTAACMVHAILEAGEAGERAAHLTVLYAQDNARIDPGLYTREYVAGRIEGRVRNYLASGKGGKPTARFFDEWRTVLPRLQIQFLTWEDVLAEVSREDLDEFYDLCVRFNAP
jgi:hypothetical protein